MTAEDVLQKAREVCDAAGWDREEAEAKLRDKMRRSPALRTALADWACRHAVRIVVRGRRDELERDEKASRSNIIAGRAERASREGSARANARARDTLLDYPLLDGVLLGDARKQDVLSMKHVHEKQRAAADVKARWLGSIADALKNERETVREALGAEGVRQLWTEAQDD